MRSASEFVQVFTKSGRHGHRRVPSPANGGEDFEAIDAAREVYIEHGRIRLEVLMMRKTSITVRSTDGAKCVALEMGPQNFRDLLFVLDNEDECVFHPGIPSCIESSMACE